MACGLVVASPPFPPGTAVLLPRKSGKSLLWRGFVSKFLCIGAETGNEQKIAGGMRKKSPYLLVNLNVGRRGNEDVFFAVENGRVRRPDR